MLFIKLFFIPLTLCAHATMNYGMENTSFTIDTKNLAAMLNRPKRTVGGENILPQLHFTNLLIPQEIVAPIIVHAITSGVHNNVQNPETNLFKVLPQVCKNWASFMHYYNDQLHVAVIEQGVQMTQQSYNCYIDRMKTPTADDCYFLNSDYLDCNQAPSTTKAIERHTLFILNFNDALYSHLATACLESNIKAVKRLLKRGAHVDKTAFLSCNPFYQSCEKKSIQCAKLLMKHAPALFNNNSALKEKLLKKVVDDNYTTMAAWLIHTKADVNYDGGACLQRAVQHRIANPLPMVQLLINAGANPHLPVNDGPDKGKNSFDLLKEVYIHNDQYLSDGKELYDTLIHYYTLQKNGALNNPH